MTDIPHQEQAAKATGSVETGADPPPFSLEQLAWIDHLIVNRQTPAPCVTLRDEATSRAGDPLMTVASSPGESQHAVMGMVPGTVQSSFTLRMLLSAAVVSAVGGQCRRGVPPFCFVLFFNN